MTVAGRLDQFRLNFVFRLGFVLLLDVVLAYQPLHPLADAGVDSRCFFCGKRLLLVRRLIEPVLPDVPVISLGELPPQVAIESLAVWEIANAA